MLFCGADSCSGGDECKVAANNKSDGVFFKKEGEDAKQERECSHNCLTACEEQC